MKKYENYIGGKIVCEHVPYQFSSPHEALKAELVKSIFTERGYESAILVGFRDISVNVSEKTNRIVVSGVISQCEADC